MFGTRRRIKKSKMIMDSILHDDELLTRYLSVLDDIYRSNECNPALAISVLSNMIANDFTVKKEISEPVSQTIVLFYNTKNREFKEMAVRNYIR
jgi:hypothetical protein